MSPQENKAHALRMVDAWNRGDPDAVIAYWAPDAVHYDEDGSRMPADRIADIMRGTLDSFPDLRLEARSVVAEGDRVMLRITATATHRGDFMGVPATNAPVTWHYLEELLFDEQGRVTAHWDVVNFGPLYRVLGQIPDGL